MMMSDFHNVPEGLAAGILIARTTNQLMNKLLLF